MNASRKVVFLLALAVCVGLPVGISHAQSPTVELSQNGTSASYQVALDEMYFPGRGIRKVSLQSNLEDLKSVAVEFILSTKESAFLVLYPPGEQRNAENRRVLTDEIVVQASEGAAGSLSGRNGVHNVTPIGFAPGFYKVTVSNPMETLTTAEDIKSVPGVKSVEPQIAVEMQKRDVPNDPLFPQQWHLENSGQNGGTAGVDVNVVSVWDTYKGNNVVIGIVDDGLEGTHEDLAPGYLGSLGYDFNDNDSDPSPVLADGDFHGTSCAGVAAARGFNSVGVSGVAPLASLAGLRLLGGAITDLQIGNSVAHQKNAIHIKSNSWGPPALTLSGPGTVTRAAMLDAVTNGRNGRGTVMLWAGGNDAGANDNVNYDGYANSVYVIGVGAIDDQGKQASYSEPGACLLVVAPSNSASRQGITTTDITGAAGYNSAEDAASGPADVNYTAGFGGTSSATPAVAGVVALMLQANSSLTWRDVKNILVRTARQNDPGDADWTVNGAGLSFNDKYGAGLVDAAAAVDMARTAPRLDLMREASFPATGLPIPIPENDPVGITVNIPVSTNIRSLENVVLVFSANHTYRGDLVITLTSPFGTESVLATTRGDGDNNYVSWPFMTVKNWGEDPNGTWKLKVSDELGIDIGTLTGATLVLYGTSSSSGGVGGGPVGSDNVVVQVNSPSGDERFASGSVSIKGEATSSTADVVRVEYRHFTFGKVSENSKPDLRWKQAAGTDNWSFQAKLERAENIFHVRAINADGEISYVKTVRLLTR